MCAWWNISQHTLADNVHFPRQGFPHWWPLFFINHHHQKANLGPTPSSVLLQSRVDGTGLTAVTKGPQDKLVQTREKAAVHWVSQSQTRLKQHPPQIASLDSMGRVIIFALVSRLNQSILWSFVTAVKPKDRKDGNWDCSRESCNHMSRKEGSLEQGSGSGRPGSVYFEDKAYRVCSSFRCVFLEEEMCQG